MVSDNLVIWIVALALEWFFLARRKGDGDNMGNTGLQNLGWFLIFLTSAIGIAVIESGESALAFILGGFGMLLSIIKFVQNFND